MPEDYIPETLPEEELPEEGGEPSGAQPSGGEGPGLRDRIGQGRDRLDQFRDRKDRKGEREGEGGPKSRAQKRQEAKQAKKPGPEKTGMGKEGADKTGKAVGKGAEKAGKAADKVAGKGAEKAGEKMAEKAAEQAASSAASAAATPLAGTAVKVAGKAVEKTGGWKSAGKKIALSAGGVIVGGIVIIAALFGLSGSSGPGSSSSVVVVNGGTFPIPPEYDYSYSDTWGACRGGSSRGHKGVDIMADTGTPSVACVTGEITRAKKEDTGNSGRYIIIKDSEGNTYHYMHMDTVSVNVGDKVNVGDLIGTVGYTGNASASAPHIHFEFHPGGGGSSRTAFELLCSWDTKPPSSCP